MAHIADLTHEDAAINASLARPRFRYDHLLPANWPTGADRKILYAMQDRLVARDQTNHAAIAWYRTLNL